jgi:hypothetical protein
MTGLSVNPAVSGVSDHDPGARAGGGPDWRAIRRNWAVDALPGRGAGVRWRTVAVSYSAYDSGRWMTTNADDAPAARI